MGDSAAAVFGDGRVEDAAVVDVSTAPGGTLVQSLDFFRAFVGDLYVLGRIAAAHALSDVHAMGGRGMTAMAMCTVSLASEELMEEDLYQMLR